MKTVADIKIEVDKINKTMEEAEKLKRKKLFELYASCPTITKLADDLENMKNGEYFLDEENMLCYGIYLPDTILKLPYIDDFYNDFLGYSWIDSGRLCQLIDSAPICINWNHNRQSPFIFQGRESIIIRKSTFNMDGDQLPASYVAAKIELRQQKAGEFGDVIEIDAYHGQYMRHFSTHENLPPELGILCRNGNTEEIIKELEAYIAGIEDAL